MKECGFERIRTLNHLFLQNGKGQAIKYIYNKQKEEKALLDDLLVLHLLAYIYSSCHFNAAYVM